MIGLAVSTKTQPFKKPTRMAGTPLTHVNFDWLLLCVVIGFRLSMATIMLGTALHVFWYGT